MNRERTRRGEQRDDQQKKEEIHSYRRDRERITGIDGERIKGKMNRRFENVLNDRICRRLCRKSQMHDGIGRPVGPRF